MAPDLGPGTTIGGYRIEAVLGMGGMGVVYRATQLALDRTVALKLIAADLALDDAFRERFRSESKLLARIDHPNVVTVHEAGEHDGRMFIAMRFVQGTDLRSILDSEGPLEPGRAADLIAQVGAALDAAHRGGLVHRDVKPGNVLIEDREGREHAYLTDFGLTKAAGATSGGLTATGQWVGTLDYIAPEQIEGTVVDARADVYALGCMLHTLLAGTAPFASKDSQVSKIYAHLNEPPPSLAELAPALASTFDPVVHRAMAKSPDDRYPSAGDLGRAALAAARGERPSQPEHTVAAGAAAPVSQPTRSAPAAPTETRDRTRPSAGLVAAVVAGVAALAVAAVLVLGGGGDEEAAQDRAALEKVGLETTSAPVGSTPRGVAIGEDGGVWVANLGGGSVTRVDERGRADKAIFVDGNPSSIAAGGGYVWVLTDPERELKRLNPRTKQVDREINLRNGTPGELAFGEGALWVTDPERGKLLKVATSGRVEERFHVDGGVAGPLAVGGGRVWVASNDVSYERSTVRPVDAASGGVDREIDIAPVGGGGVAYGEEGVWAGNANQNLVAQIDPEELRVIRRVKVPTGVGEGAQSVAVGGGAVWVLETASGDVVRLDPETGRKAGEITTVSTDGDSRMVVGEDAAWITSPDDRLIRLGFR